MGKPRDPELASLISEYETRASRYWPISFHEVRAVTGRSSQADVVRRLEGERLLAAIPECRKLVACDDSGTGMQSREFSEWLVRERDAGTMLCFVIGGANGLDAAVTNAATAKLSLSQFTLPHELARLVLIEQIYRAGTIMRGEPYHK